VLDAVDLDATDQAIYEVLVDGPSATVDDLQAALALGPGRVQAVVEARGLVTPPTDGAII
jgi:hypothetical protein